MSHNVEIRGIRVDRPDLLKRAVEELRSEGYEIALEENAVIRAYTPHYAVKCDYVIRLTGQPYDVGLRREADGTFTAVGEGGIGADISGGRTGTMGKFGSFWPGHYGVSPVGATVGSQTLNGETCETMGPAASIGRVLQRYNILTAEEEAAGMGYVSSREFDPKTGIMQLTVET